MADRPSTASKSAAVEAVPEPHEPFDTGELGRDPEHFEKAPADLRTQVDLALDMQMVSVRLPKVLIAELKLIGDYRGIGYQPLMRDVLHRFSRCEMLQIASEMQEAEKARATIAAAQEAASLAKKRA